MNKQEVIERIKDDIEDVISHYTELKREGTRLKGCCPLHGEKTPSFFVTPARGMFKCFGCGKGGDAISFIQLHDNVGFNEAIEIGAKKLGLDYRKEEDKHFNNEEYQHLQSLRIASAKAAQFYTEQLKADAPARAYMEQVRAFPLMDDDPLMPGYAPDGNVFLKWAKAQGFKTELLIEAGLIKTGDDGSLYDTFRNRIMFPISNKSGDVIGFSGRTLSTDGKTAKFLNTAETPIFTKGNELYAINIARHAIRKYDRAYLVEGNMDVMRMHRIGVDNTVAPCGTALTTEQATLLKHYTNKVTLVYDGDKAGRSAVTRNAEILIKQQFYVSVIMLPDGEDPDTAFITRELFDGYNEKAQDYIIWKVENLSQKAQNPVYKGELIKDTTALIACYDEPFRQEVYLDAVSAIIKPKKAWQDQLKTIVQEKAPVEKKSILPKGINMEDFYEWGFSVSANCYYFQDTKGKAIQQSNFTMSPLFHIESTTNAKRLFEVKNKHGVVRVIEIPQKDMVSLQAFKVRIESLGNFMWTGSDSDLNKLKGWLYEKTETCKEITQLGWQKEGFFAWGNGIYNGKFTEVDKYGIVRHDSHNYYIPAQSAIYTSEENLYEFERKFIHMEGNITLREYVAKFTKVFGDNGKIALCFYFAALFRDVIVRRFDKYPILNLFGPKGAGKNACAESLLHFFGLKPKIPNLHNTSKPALADHVATSANAICVFDEYRNDLDMEKREFLKGLWDGTGRTRMNMDKDKKKETTSVDQAVIVCGQQMATADIALFSRFVVLSFTQVEYSDDEKRNFEELEEINKRGLTHITHQVLKHRGWFIDKYREHTEAVTEEFKTALNGQVVETRIFNNWLSIMGAYSTLESELELPWNYRETMQLAVRLMLVQNSETKKNDDLGTFWKTVQYLIASNILIEGGDYKTGYTNKLVWRKGNQPGDHETMRWMEGKNVLWLNMQRVFSLYKSQAGREGDKPLPESTVEYYLKNSKAFICETKKESFKKIDPKTGLQEVRKETAKDHFGVELIVEKKMRTSTTALVFDLDMLNLNVAVEDNNDEQEQGNEQTQQTEPAESKHDDQSKLPF